ncbi:MAG: hypothetical protein MJZ46_03490 [Bacteroidales bacterium]|nr:hypothetical protein [Bacteroidales bacterium]
MCTGGLKSALRVNASNIPGWRTNRHIIVIESDDWGSVRMSSLESFERMKQAGMPVEQGNLQQLKLSIENLANRKEAYSAGCRKRAEMCFGKKNRFEDYVKLFDEVASTK